ncbi:MAG: hypothetical protein MUF48_20425 [Pirellulaceae bacterium]|nr:hypothetical protein [Pirellulaceae bacterium]
MGRADASSASGIYAARSAHFAAEAARLARHSRWLVVVRGLTFLSALAALLIAYSEPSVRPFWTAASTAMLAGFLAAVVWDDQRKQRQERCEQLRSINDHLLARCLRRWTALPVPEVSVPPEHAAVARDLDLFGRASVYQLVNLAHTPRGRCLLRDWLLEPAAPQEIRDRQAAVQELVPRWEWREALLLRGSGITHSVTGPEPFVAWAEGVPYFQRRPWIKWGARLLTAAGFLALAGLMTGLLTPDVGGSALVVVLVLNVLFSVLFTGAVHDLFDSITTRCGELQQYRELFDLLASLSPTAPRLAALRQVAVQEQQGAVVQLRRLRRIMQLAGLRHATWLSILYFGLQATVLWDFHVLVLLERWQRRCAGLVRRWFEALAELEALGSLACLAFDHPQWCFPDVAAAHRELRATNLGHPLLPAAVCVGNDVQVGPAGTILLVTGSNMSGKSTLLRALGVNVLLASAGGPACARTLELPQLIVTTSMRIEDSLEDGVSLFLAELRRLKQIVDQATELADRDDRTLLYLLDEVLQGTNSGERHVAVTRVLAHLVSTGALGAVSTHDLALAQAPDLVACCRPVHFRETLHGDGADELMTFDYRLLPGVATTRNALRLLALVGLAPPPEQDRSASHE